MEIGLLESEAQNKVLNFEDEVHSEQHFEEIVGRSEALQYALREVEVVAPTDSGVLILGETGTGKELVARAIHNLSARRDRPFIKLNCAAIPSGLLESELFGHERGAFTGAIMRKAGRFEVAHRGTLFLDEVGDIPMER
jgi:formate hydrogenlyase transcriptional activator